MNSHASDETSKDAVILPDEPLEEAGASSQMRQLSRWWQIVFAGLAALMAGFYLYAGGGAHLIGVLAPVLDTFLTNGQYFRGLYVLLTYVLILLAFPLWQNQTQPRSTLWGWLRGSSQYPSAIDLLLCVCSIAIVVYYMVQFETFNYRVGGGEVWLDILVSIVGVLISLEIARRVLGWPVTLVGVFFIIYGLFGNYFPEPFTNRGYSVERLSTTLFMAQDGVFGIMVHVLINYVILFIFFGAFLQKSGVGKFFIEWPLAFAGRTTGGPAKVAVIASAFFGSVSGSAIANTASTGTFTIPLMKKAGFKPHVAGGIEPAASIGGMFMPPIMGAGGFLMAELTGIPYREIMLYSLLPAVVYFFSVLMQVHFEAKLHGLKGFSIAGSSATAIFLRHWYKITPLVVIVFLMLLGYSPSLAAFWGTLSCVAVSWVDPQYRMGPRQIWEAIVDGSRNTLIIGATLGVIGIIIGTIALSGVGNKLATIILSLAQGSLPLALLLVGIAALILGMGVPVAASYMILVPVAVPALYSLLTAGAPPADYTQLTANSSLVAVQSLLAAHMIIYWLTQFANVTPPVCVAAYTGAAIAKADPWKTGWTACRFAQMLYIAPFLFAYQPAFLLFGTPFEVIVTFVAIFIGIIAFAAATIGYLLRPTSIFERICLAIAAFLCFYPDHWLSLLGASILFLVLSMQVASSDAARNVIRVWVKKFTVQRSQ